MNISDIKQYNKYYFYRNILKDTLSKLLNCNVTLVDNPIEYMNEKYNIDILDNAEQNVYQVDSRVLLICKIKDGENIIAYSGLELQCMNKWNSILMNRVSNAITKVLSQLNNDNFNNASYMFSNGLVYGIIFSTFFKGEYERDKIMYLIHKLEQVRDKTFESKYFTTGLIITKSVSNYTKKANKKGEVIKLKKPIKLFIEPDIDKRSWYLVDGKESFFLCDKNVEIENIFIKEYDGEDVKEFFDNYTLKSYISGYDVIFRIINSTQFSIMNSKGIEFINIEGSWKIRDYTLLRTLIGDKLEIDDSVKNSLIYYIMHCSHNGISSIIWMPNVKKIKSSSKITSKYFKSVNRLCEKSINITKTNHRNSVIRYLSSDGVNVINNEGKIKYFGCIVNLDKAEIKSISGTGEVAAKLLGDRGVAIKISQDGDIKLFYDNNEEILKF